MKVGILNSGGDCPGVNYSICATTQALKSLMPACEVVGISDGFIGLVKNDLRPLTNDSCSFIHTSRICCDDISDEDINVMKSNYDTSGLASLIIFGGDNTAKTAYRLYEAGINVIFVPKTVDNNVYGTDVSLGFYSAGQNAAAAIQNVTETARNHSKIMIAEIGDESGWLTLYSGLAGGADIILLPEIPYSYKNILMAIENRQKAGFAYSVIAISSKAKTQDEFRMNTEELAEKRKLDGESYISLHFANIIRDMSGIEAQAVIPSSIILSGEPCAYDKLLARKFANRIANLVRSGETGVAVTEKNQIIDTEDLFELTTKTKIVRPDDPMLSTALGLGIKLGI